MWQSKHRSVVFVQYAGDYAEAYRRLRSGGAETYYAQRYSIDAVSGLVNANTSVATICCTADSNEDVILENGVRSISMHSPGGVSEDRVWSAIVECGATHLCLRTPLRRVLARAIRSRSIDSVLLTLADSFGGTGLRVALKNWALRRLMNHRKVAAVGNHGRNSSESLRRIGIDARKIVPWDWPHEVSPHQKLPKLAPQGNGLNLLFVGILSESKGLGDVLRAVHHLKGDGTRVALSYAGRGEAEVFSALAEELDIVDRVHPLGMVAHDSIVGLMREADAVVVPSRHDYPEGFPMTIYEALSSRTPIIASDHPMYSRHLRDTRSALIFEAGSHESLALAIKQLASDPVLYASLSAASAGAWDKLQLPITWGSFVENWLSTKPDVRARLCEHALSRIPLSASVTAP